MLYRILRWNYAGVFCDIFKRLKAEKLKLKRPNGQFEAEAKRGAELAFGQVGLRASWPSGKLKGELKADS